MQLSDSRVLEGVHVFVVSHGFQEAYERGFCNGLAANGAQVTLAASDKTEQARFRRNIRILNIRGSQDPARTKLQKAFNLIRYHMQLMLLVWRERSSCLHVIGLTDPPLLTGVFEGVVFRFLSRKYVLTVHNALPHDRRTRWNRLVYRLLYCVPQYLVVHTETMRDRLLKEFKICRDKILVMEHGCEFDVAPAFPPRPRKKPGLNILFFGYVAPYKGVDILLDAFAQLPPNYELRIVGYCRSPTLRESLTQKIHELSSSRAVSWRKEYVSDGDMADAMSWADILVLPYRHIDQSGVMFQSLKFGVPMVVTRVGEFESMVTKDIGDVCDPEDVQSLVDAVIRLAARIETVSRERIAALAGRYDWRKTVRRLATAYG